MKNLEEIKLRAEKIIGNSNLNVVNNEKELMVKLSEISEGNIENIDNDLTDKTLDNIEMYLKTKEKMLISKEDYEYLVQLSEELNKQAVRRTDGILYVSMFKVLGKDKNERSFLIRKHAENYIDVYREDFNNKIVEIKEMDNSDLIKLLEIIKRNF